MIDICSGNLVEEKRAVSFASLLEEANLQGNFRMCQRPTNPISYLKNLGINKPFRFILTHPDMDHLDGFKALRDGVGISNFWDSGVRKDKPEFNDQSPYLEADWDEYVAVRDGKREGTTIVTPRAGGRFKFANKNEDETTGGDALYIYAPNQALVDAANNADDPNDGSYVIIYHTRGGKIIFPGDAHDETWKFVTTKYPDHIKDCSVLIFPHHGRKSDRSYEFLDKIKPKLTLLGCAPCEHMAYDALNRRNLEHITNNQGGNILLSANDQGIDVFVQNRTFAAKLPNFDENRLLHGCFYIGTIPQPAAA